MHDEWFADEEKVRRSVGLLEKPVVEYPNAREVCSSFSTMLLKFWKLGFWLPCLSLLQLCVSWCILCFDSWLVGYALKPILLTGFTQLLAVILFVVHAGQVCSIGMSFYMIILRKVNFSKNIWKMVACLLLLTVLIHKKIIFKNWLQRNKQLPFG